MRAHYILSQHNAPTGIYTDVEEPKEAINNIKEYNLDNMPDGCQK